MIFLNKKVLYRIMYFYYKNGMFSCIIKCHLCYFTVSYKFMGKNTMEEDRTLNVMQLLSNNIKKMKTFFFLSFYKHITSVKVFGVLF